jgi:hypothetical protein
MSLIFFIILYCSLVFSKPIEDSRLDLNEVAYQNEKSKIYLGSPSIVRLSSGRLLASHDFFGIGYNTSVKNASIYSSDDNGLTWSFISYIKPSFFTSLTVYENRVYAIGVNGEHRSGIIIHRSIDQGLTWNYNNNSNGIVLFKGAFSTGATGIVMGNNIIYRSIEYRTVPGHWPDEFQAAIISCNLTLLSRDNIIENDPLMNPTNWKITPPLYLDKNWFPSSYPNLTAPGYLEGSVVISSKLNSSNIRVFNVMRFNSIPLSNLAILLELNLITNNLSFISIINFPGGMSKFTIRYDIITKSYLTLSNPVISNFDFNQRNILSLSYSKDLINWNIVIDKLLYDDTGLQSNDSLHYTGFHYVDWQFDNLLSIKTNGTCIQWNCDGGPDIIYLIRTSYRGANSFHNSNRITFKTLSNFRQFIPQYQHT